VVRGKTLFREVRGLEGLIEIIGTVYNLSLEAAFPAFEQSKNQL
jgi:hypothetical protein